MKCVIFYLLTGMLLLSCATKVQKNENENTSQVNAEEESAIFDEKSTIFLLQEVMPITDTLPFGIINLITTNFPQYWQTQINENRSHEEVQLVYDSVFSTLSKYTNNYLYPTLYYNPKLNIHKNIFQERNINIIYYDNLHHVFESDFPDDDYLSPVASFFISNDLTLVLFAKTCEKLKPEKEKYQIEFPHYGYERIDAIVFKQGEVYDALNLFYHVFWSYGGCDKLFYIDKNGVIHLKYFIVDEIDTYFIRYEKYQVSPQGKIIRYYDKDGRFETEEEQGLVKNNKRDGKWVEMKFNGYFNFRTDWGIRDNYTYLEAEYQDGLPANEWKFYRMEQEYDENGRPILSTRRKGKLLYTEMYDNGEFVKREFVKE